MIKKIFNDFIYSGRFTALAILFLILLIPLRNLIYKKISGNNEPLAVTTIYRLPGGDVEYFPLVNAISKGNFGECSLIESKGKGLQRFPFAPLIIHAFLYSIFGIWGLWIGDIVFTFLFFIGFYFLMRILDVGRTLSLAFSFFICSGALTALLYKFNVPILGDFWIWGTRFPRPFVSECFFLYILICCFALIFYKDKVLHRNLFWLFFGSLNALMIQSDIYTGFAIIIAEFLLIIWILLEKVKPKYIIKGILIAFLSFLIVLCPFLIQNMEWKSGLLIKPIFYEINNYSPFIIAVNSVIPLILLILTTCFLILLVLNYKTEKSVFYNRIKGLGFTILIAISGIYAMALFVLIFRKGITMYHFVEVSVRFYSYSYLIAGILLFTIFRDNLFSKICNKINLKTKSLIKTVILVIAIILGMREAYKRAERDVNYNEHMYPSGFSYKYNYRECFTKLTDKLNKLSVNKESVLATLDPQVNSYWLTFNNGYSFLPELFETTSGDEIIEERLILFGKINNLSDTLFSKILEKPCRVFWFGGGKYLVNSSYTFASFDLYSPIQKKEISNIGVCREGLIVPEIELERMRKKYKNLKMGKLPKIDYMVLTTMESFAPDTNIFSLIYQNDVFRLYEFNQSLSN